MTTDDAEPREWLSARAGADADTQMVMLCLLAGRGVTLDDGDLRGALRRAELLLATGGDPRRPLELYGRAVTALAIDLDDPGARAQLATALSELGRELGPLHDLTEPLRLLMHDADLAWQCYAMSLLAEELADDAPLSG